MTDKPGAGRPATTPDEDKASNGKTRRFPPRFEGWVEERREHGESWTATVMRLCGYAGPVPVFTPKGEGQGP